MNLCEVHEKLGTNEQCLEYIEKMRWPDGVVRCPTCGDKNVERDLSALLEKKRNNG